MSKEVFFNNKKYLSSKDAGNQAGYTHDYISRLCRERRIPGEKVGGSWYVEAEPFFIFLDEQKNKKSESNKNLSKECKQNYKKTTEEYEEQVMSRLELPEFPKYLLQEVTAVVISIVLVFGVYFAKDSLYVRDVIDSSQSNISRIYEDTNDSVNTFRELFTYKNIANSTLKVVTSGSNIIEQGLVRYYSFINTSGEVVVATSHKVKEIKRQVTVENIKTTTTNKVTKIVALVSERVKKLNQDIKNVAHKIKYTFTKENTLTLVSSTKNYIVSSASSAVFNTQLAMTSAQGALISAPEFIGRFIEGIRVRLVSWLNVNDVKTPFATVTEKDDTAVLITQPTIKRVIETQHVVVQSGITESFVLTKLEQLNNKLKSEIYKLSSINAGNIVNNYNVISQTNKIDKLKGVAITGSTFTDGTISGSTSFSGTTGSFSGAVSVASLTVTGDTTLSGSLSLGGLTVDTAGLVYLSSSSNVGIGTSTPYAKLSVVGPVVGEYFHATSTTATSTFAGALLVTRAPTVAHTFSSWVTGASNSALFDASLVINPTTATADSNLISAAVGGSVRFLVDAEGDVFVKNLTSVGSVTLSTTSASSFTVEGNTTLGDAITDTTTINGTLTVTGATSVSTVDGNFGVGTTSPWARLSVSGVAGASTPLFSISTTTAGNATSTAIFVDENGKFGIGTTSPFAQLSVAGNGLFSGTLTTTNLIASSISTLNSLSLTGLATFTNGFISQASSTISSGGLTTVGYSTTTKALVVQGASATSTFAGGLAVETSGFVYDYSTNRVGIGTTSPLAKLDIYGDIILSGTDRHLNFGDTSGTNGYGFRDNSGTMQFKDSAGAWAAFGSGGGSDIFSLTDATTVEATTTNAGISLKLDYFTATSTTATSTFAGGLAIETSGLVYDYSTGNVGIGTASPTQALDVGSGNITTTGTLAAGATTLNGQTIVGGTGSVSVGSLVGELQVQKTGTNVAAFSAYENFTSGAGLVLGHSRGTSIGAFNTVITGDGVGHIDFAAADGTDLNNLAASILVSVEGTIAGNRTPGKIEFQTGADAAGSALTTALTLDSSQNSTFAGTIGSDIITITSASDQKLILAGSASPRLTLTPTSGDEFSIQNNTGVLKFTNNTDSDRVDLTIDGDGNVGIGTSTPWGKLSVEMDTVNPSFVVSNQGSSTPALYISGVNQDGVIGIGTKGGSGRRLDVFDAGNPQLRLSQTSSIFTNFQVAASTGDLTIDLNPNTSATDIYMTQTGGTTGANLRVCEGTACPSVVINNGGNVLVENAVYFGNGFRIDQVVGTTTEIAVYGVTSTTTPIIIFDEF